MSPRSQTECPSPGCLPEIWCKQGRTTFESMCGAHATIQVQAWQIDSWMITRTVSQSSAKQRSAGMSTSPARPRPMPRLPWDITKGIVCVMKATQAIPASTSTCEIHAQFDKRCEQAIVRQGPLEGVRPHIQNHHLGVPAPGRQGAREIVV